MSMILLSLYAGLARSWLPIYSHFKCILSAIWAISRSSFPSGVFSLLKHLSLWILHWTHFQSIYCSGVSPVISPPGRSSPVEQSQRGSVLLGREVVPSLSLSKFSASLMCMLSRSSSIVPSYRPNDGQFADSPQPALLGTILK